MELNRKWFNSGPLEEKRIVGNRPFDCRCRFVSQHDCDWWGERWLEHPARVCVDDGTWKESFQGD
ncbi:hypothetical protein RBSWK_05925 [Rhodopirellula baltica SWK14]|uniref:Uncharacterized protein n=1 Tax=Rhodopirellula baltica SWK14 TaxID=993516 RepID=L7C931_RHOBT|nr:hypothetical protein RBSWK_05925 [Rhodopirellula baltica SWK14]